MSTCALYSVLLCIGMGMQTRSTDADRLLSPEQLATFLGVPLATVYRWRTRGGGPRGIRVGRHVRYRLSDVESWLEDHADPEPA